MSLDSEITQVASDTLVKLKVVWDEVGSSQDDRRCYVDQMAHDVLAVYESYYEKALLHRCELKQHIIDQAQLLCTMSDELGEGSSFEISEISNLPLNAQISLLNERVDLLEQTRTERAVHLEALVEKLRLTQTELGIELEYTYIKQTNDSCDADNGGSNVSLDSTKDFSLQHIKNVEDTLSRALEIKTKREIEVTALESDLAELCSEMGQLYESPIAANRLREAVIEQLRDRVSALFQLRAKRQEELATLAERITVLWDKLVVSPSLREAWVLQNSGKITDNVILACEYELARLHDIYGVHVLQEIEVAKSRLQILWDELSIFIINPNKNIFDRKDIPELDRTMPELEGCSIEEKLARVINHKSSLESHLATIRPLIEMINEREHLHAQKADFEEKASNPSRLLSKKTKRDPGWLLKEEQIRKSFTTKVPKLEASLRKGLIEYQNTQHKPFLYNGEPYLDRMLTQEEKEKRKKEDEKNRKDKEKAQLLEKEILYGSAMPTPTSKTPAKTKIASTSQTPFTPRSLNTSTVHSSKRKRPALSPITTPKKMNRTLDASMLETTQLRFDDHDGEY